MPVIRLETQLNAPVQRCFDLSRSIDLHQISTHHTGEAAIAGRTSGLIEQGESVTWRAKHFGIWQNLTSKITAMQSPVFFVDEMVKGAFSSFKHHHLFLKEHELTIMTDVFEYKSPLGPLGRLADFLFLKKYMKTLLIKRNCVIKQYAESDKWHEILNKS